MPGAPIFSGPKPLLVFSLVILQGMNDLQAVAFESSAYDPVADRDDGKEELKEVIKHKEF